MAKIRERAQRMMSSTQVEVVNPSDPSDPSWEILKRDIWSTKLLWMSIGPVAPGGKVVSSDSSWAAKGAEMAKVATITSVATTQQQEGVRLQQVDESGMVGLCLPWELELTFHHHCLYISR